MYAMVKVTIGNSNSVIEGLDRAPLMELRQVLSYTTQPQNKNFQKYARRICLIDRRGEFPTGLLHLVLKFLNREKLPHYTVELRKKPESKPGMFKLNLDITPYSEQEDIARLPSQHHRGVISACTGFGKSIAMAMLVNRLQMKTLIIVPNLTLKQQLIESFTKYFGQLVNIIIENIDNTALSTMTDFDCLIIDEAHHVAAKTYRKLNKKAWTKIYYRYFFTATPFRSKEEEQILFESIAGQEVYGIAYKDAVNAQYIVPVEAYYYEVPETHEAKSLETWPAVYSTLCSKNDKLNWVIVNLLISLRKSNVSTLCLVKEIHHGRELSEITGAPFVNGQEGNKHLIADFNSNRSSSLIGTYGVVGEGVDTKAAEFVIIGGLGRSKVAFMQQVGRGVRKYPGKESCKVIIFKDKSHKWTLNHFKAQCKILKEEYQAIPVKLELATS